MDAGAGEGPPVSLAELKCGINIARALATDGWMSEAELFWLATQAQQHRRIVELGSFLGRSTRALADHTPGIVYAWTTGTGRAARAWRARQHRAQRRGARRALRPLLRQHVGT
jgi:predicted O-methyltransferase YrrM